MLCKVAFCALSHSQPNNLLHIRTLVLGVGLSLVTQEHHQNMKLNDWLQPFYHPVPLRLP